MIDPANIDMLPINYSLSNTIQLDQIPEYDDPVYNLADEKSLNTFMKDLEREVRSSFEYKRLVNYLKNYMGMNRCAFLERTTMNPDSKVTIEIHHHPFTLFDICLAVVAKRQYYGESMELEMVAKEVIKLHYEGKIGLIPLSKTPHELYHNGFLPIPLSKVYGNWRAFKNEYWDFLNSEQQDIIERIEQFDKDTYNEDRAREVLKQNNIYINSSIEEYQIPDFHPLAERIAERVQVIKQNHYQLPTIDQNAVIEQQRMLKDKQKKEEERKANLKNPFVQYTNPFVEVKPIEDIQMD